MSSLPLETTVPRMNWLIDKAFDRFIGNESNRHCTNMYILFSYIFFKYSIFET